ncbi:hypothetical protein DLAC_02899 [Tieghemostelium lacteum]|uniref:Heparan-alpha-glucosaminide N-acetyltransferase catalytic domain-containing protein n=1 Tax=Tieghemostelium lacteum TaxID=361077 RepID=A0A152A422_TIELA|nr:hypothetical protein DLAC_02899 [Tieghemostelium lacteum]|eukprot:KYR00845.1 hypothetical protein DLAC_02899 [Tieghemostelium lacteum]
MNIQESTPLLNRNNDTIVVINKIKESKPESPQTKKRILCLDTARGLTIFGMILVDNQGGDYVIWPLKETSWNGLSTADLIFPSFIFISGFSVALALKNSKNDIKTWSNIIRRTFLLFFIQCFLNLMAHKFVFDSFRIMGVLQRIALCYFLSCFSFLCFSKWVQRLFLAACSIVYLALMYGYPVPGGCGRGNTTPTCNAGAYFDHSVFHNNMIQPNDPEGLLSTLMAFVTCWGGVEFGRIFTNYFKKHSYANTDIVFRWILVSTLFLIPSIAIACTVIPFNKLIWSFSFALFTVSMGGYFISILYLLIDIIPWKSNRTRNLINKSVQPFVWIGMNPITIYSLMIFIEILLMFYIKVHNEYFWTRSYEVLYLSWLKNPYLASTVFSLVWFVFYDAIAYLMYRNKIFIKL